MAVTQRPIEPSSRWCVQFVQEDFHMPEWLTQLIALIALLGIINLCFWKARGVKPRNGNRDDNQNYFTHTNF